MRKLIITAHSLYKNDRKYDVNHNSQGGIAERESE